MSLSMRVQDLGTGAAVYLPVLAKSATVLGVGWGLFVTLSPPNPAMLGLDLARKKDERWTERLLLGITPLVKSLSWLTGAIELHMSFYSSNWRVNPYTLTAFALGVGGGLWRRACYKALGKRFIFNIDGRRHSEHPAERLPLVKVGPYSVVRHPAYISAVVTWSAFALVFLNSEGSVGGSIAKMKTLHPILVLLSALLPLPLIARIPREETSLNDEFGKEWMDYTVRVPWKMVPWVW
ncbi:hypothetical protein BKA62DRAFT_414211 [Auriculariales sp. MPI-PUGE-AT-0066]|nr:hypothetical protein BKA62DRAFT_414211 [Auriculariales sp. MPI-PUGE-AT-0066]